jgi:hypothetical protein
MVHPTKVVEHRGASGEPVTLSPDAPGVQQTRAEVLRDFERILRELVQACVSQIPGGGRWQVRINRIPEQSPGVPDFSGLTVAQRDPIVYLTTREAEQNPASPQNRRASLTLFEALRGRYAEFPDRLYRHSRDQVTGDPRTIEGKAMHFSDYFPATAEVFSDASMSYDATNWKEIQANLFARVAFHEMAHCKAECANRGSSSRWQGALSGSIHDQSGIGICGSTVGWSDSQTAGDKRLFAQHMLCPIPFYRLDQPIEQQFYSGGRQIQLTSTSSEESSDSEAGREQAEPLDVDSLDF